MFTIGVQFPKKCRTDLQEIDKLLNQHPKIKPYYTGMAGKRFCFAFTTETEKLQTAEQLHQMAVRHNSDIIIYG
jgi:hypothetical protein